MLSEWRNENNSLYFRSKSIVLSSVQKDRARQQIFTYSVSSLSACVEGQIERLGRQVFNKGIKQGREGEQQGEAQRQEERQEGQGTEAQLETPVIVWPVRPELVYKRNLLGNSSPPAWIMKHAQNKTKSSKDVLTCQAQAPLSLWHFFSSVHCHPPKCLPSLINCLWLISLSKSPGNRRLQNPQLSKPARR